MEWLEVFDTLERQIKRAAFVDLVTLAVNARDSRNPWPHISEHSFDQIVVVRDYIVLHEHHVFGSQNGRRSVVERCHGGFHLL